jgi:hypothetical protein
MGENIVIKLDAKEILDYVDDMLAWEMIASNGEIRFLQQHFFRAEPWIRVGSQLGLLCPDSVEVREDDAVSSDAYIPQNSANIAKFSKTLPGILKRPEFQSIRYARIVECMPGQDTMAVIRSDMWCGGDNVDDVTTNFGGVQLCKGVRYCIDSVGELNGLARKRYARSFHMPEVARMFIHQYVVAFEDGRAASGSFLFAYFNERLFDMNKMPIRRTIRLGDDGIDEIYSEQEALTDAIIGMSNRLTHWTVELALSKCRTGIGLDTDAIGARELGNMLRAADTSEGRRKSLIHWVDEHMRRRRAMDEEATIKVRAHFRGQNNFDAGRYHVRIYPSDAEVRKSSNGARFVNPIFQNLGRYGAKCEDLLAIRGLEGDDE